MASSRYDATVSIIGENKYKKMCIRNNMDASFRLLAHISSIIVIAIFSSLSILTWIVLIFPLGALTVFLFAPLHEAIHRTAFRSRRINDTVAFFLGLVLLLPPTSFRYFHLQHHRYTGDPARDPELLARNPNSTFQYMDYLTGRRYWLGMIQGILANARGQIFGNFIPAGARNKIRNESRIFIVIYLLLLIISIYLRSYILVLYWVLPVMLGQPFLRAYILSEHVECDKSDNLFDNGRTTITNYITRFFLWNTNYHSAHHCAPNVPYHQRRELHNMIGHNFSIISSGYFKFHVSYLKRIRESGLK